MISKQPFNRSIFELQRIEIEESVGRLSCWKKKDKTLHFHLNSFLSPPCRHISVIFLLLRFIQRPRLSNFTLSIDQCECVHRINENICFLPAAQCWREEMRTAKVTSNLNWATSQKIVYVSEQGGCKWSLHTARKKSLLPGNVKTKSCNDQKFQTVFTLELKWTAAPEQWDCANLTMTMKQQCFFVGRRKERKGAEKVDRYEGKISISSWFLYPQQEKFAVCHRKEGKTQQQQRFIHFHSSFLCCANPCIRKLFMQTKEKPRMNFFSMKF